MGSKKLTKHPKEKFIAPMVVQTVGMDLEEAILGASTVFTTRIEATGHEVETYSTGNYWE